MHELIRQSHPSGENYDPGRQLDSAAQALEACLEEAVAELEKIRTLGCVLRSLERGWVDFLAQKDGKQVFLCWRRGEPAVRYYHSTGRPISDRRPLA